MVQKKSEKTAQRLFLAFPVNGELAAILMRAVSNYLQIYPNLNLVQPKNYHITISFFGNAAVGEEQNFIHTLGIVLQKYAPIIFIPKNPAITLINRNADMIWVVFKENPRFNMLVKDVETQVQTAANKSIRIKTYAPVPHITIARSKEKNIDLKISTIAIKFPTLIADTVNLYASTLTSNGPIYSNLHTFALRS